MKLIFSALIVMGVSFAAASSFAADSRNVSVVNETGYAIKFLGFNGPDDGLDEWDNELSGTLTTRQALMSSSMIMTTVASGTSKSTGRTTMSRFSGGTSIYASSMCLGCVITPEPIPHRS
jgi:hypothetical protein